MGSSPQRGYNHNIAHRGRVYHVQSEDSGLTKSHIYTHIFVNGTIIATNKVDYDPQAKTDDLPAHIVALMQASHKKMIKQLRGGDLDQKIEVLLGGHPEPLASTAPEPKPQPAQPTASTAPGPLLVQNKISKTPPARRKTAIPQQPTASAPQHRNPALRSPLSSSEHARDWLSQRHREPQHEEPSSSAKHSGGAKARIAQLRQVLSQQVAEPSQEAPLEEELSRLLADR